MSKSGGWEQVAVQEAEIAGIPDRIREATLRGDEEGLTKLMARRAVLPVHRARAIASVMQELATLATAAADRAHKAAEAAAAANEAAGAALLPYWEAAQAAGAAMHQANDRLASLRQGSNLARGALTGASTLLALAVDDPDGPDAEDLAARLRNTYEQVTGDLERLAKAK